MHRNKDPGPAPSPAMHHILLALLDNAATPAHRALLETEAAVTGEPTEALATRIVRNADAWRQTIAQLTGLRRKAAALIDAQTDPDTIRQITDSAIAEITGPGAEG